MTITLAQSTDEVARLVKHFQTNMVEHCGPGHQEAQARLEFIDLGFGTLVPHARNAAYRLRAYRENVALADETCGLIEAEIRIVEGL